MPGIKGVRRNHATSSCCIAAAMGATGNTQISPRIDCECRSCLDAGPGSSHTLSQGFHWLKRLALSGFDLCNLFP